jgi:hypothetical protein
VFQAEDGANLREEFDKAWQVDFWYQVEAQRFDQIPSKASEEAGPAKIMRFSLPTRPFPFIEIHGRHGQRLERSGVLRVSKQ